MGIRPAHLNSASLVLFRTGQQPKRTMTPHPSHHERVRANAPWPRSPCSPRASCRQPPLPVTVNRRPTYVTLPPPYPYTAWASKENITSPSLSSDNADDDCQ
jgi:hypothetical protein